MIRETRRSGLRKHLPMYALAVAVASGWALPVSAQYGAEGGEWRYYGGDAGSTKYSALSQINEDNAGDLEVAWRWKMENFGAVPEFNSRVTPIMVGGVLYTSAGYRRAVAAIDAATGETLWVYRMDEGERGRVGASIEFRAGCGVLDRRVAGEDLPDHADLLPGRAECEDGSADRGVRGTTVWVDMREGLDRPLRPIDKENDPIGSSSPPIVVDDVVIVGMALPGGGAPPSMAMPPGWVRGFDALTGEQLWVFHTIPQAGEFGNETWEDDSWRYTGNTAVWTAMSADRELGYVYLPVENATNDYYGGHRPGNGLFSSGIVCLDAETGRRVWHFQFIHHDIWDYDVPAPPILVDINVDGREIKAVAQVTKQAFTYVFDRVTGEPVWPIEERPVPQSDVPGERTSPTPAVSDEASAVRPAGV